MSLKTAYSKGRRLKNYWLLSILALFIALLAVPQPGNGNTKQKKGNSHRLPAAPDTGSPQEDFAAGGTRDGQLNEQLRSGCGGDEQQIAYLLGNKNREFTSSAYPTFWFYLPHTINKIGQMKFVVRELETGKKIYDRAIQGSKTGITGISLPREKQYQLSPEVNYAWSLQVDCAETDRDSEIALAGWLSRVSSSVELQNQLAAASEAEKVAIYLNHNLLYDAITQQAQSFIAKPRNIQVKTAWNQLLNTLGWQDLVGQHSNIKPFLSNTQRYSQKN
jgi:hypothetical protein